MAEENKQDNSSAGTENTGGNETGGMIPRERFNQVIAERNRERETLAEAMKRIEQFESAEKARKEREAIERGEAAKLVDELKPKAELGERLLKREQERLDAVLAEVPENLRGLFQHGTVFERLDAIEVARKNGLFGKPKAPQTDAGATSGGQTSPTVNAKHQEAAGLLQAYGFTITPEQIAKREEELAKRRPQKDE